MKGLRDCIKLREVLKGEARLVGYNLPLIFDGLFNGREDAAYAGLKNISGRWVLTGTDEEIDPDATYTVLVPSYIYEGGDGYRIGDYDPDGHDTSVLYHQPALDWIEAQGSIKVNPIEAAEQMSVNRENQ